ncbi:MAG: SpoIIE family protein phosphatase [Micromonosporaceae bacterium]
MPSELIRRVRLPADRRTPAAARAIVRSVLTEARLTDLLDETLLLTTELSTNSVLHAGTDLELEIATDPGGVTVVVRDHALGTVQMRTPAEGEDANAEEGGRGLLLVDRFATRWGTTQHADGKGVWFRLDLPGADLPQTTAAEPEPGGGPGETFDAAILAALLEIEPDPLADDPTTRFVGELLECLAGRLAATSAAVRLDRADGAGPRTIAAFGPDVGTPLAHRHSTVRIPLPVDRLWSGELEITTPPTPLARPLAALVAERIGLAIERERLRQADLHRQAWLTFLAQASDLLAQSLDVDLTLALIPRLVVPRLGQWCAVYVIDDGNRLSLAAAAHADEPALPALVDLLGADAPDGLRDRLREAVRGSGAMPLGPPVEGFAVPLLARGQRLGALAVGRHHEYRQDPDEIAVLEDVARRAALALDNARIHADRRRIAHTLQQSLLPPELPHIAGVGLGAEYVPTGDEIEVGGDFYDIVPMPDGRWLFVIGDVSGKGVQAASVTGHVRDVIRVLVADGRPLPSVLTTLNATLAERGGGRYCTLVLAAVQRLPDGDLDVSLHLAGHDPPVLLPAHGQPSFVGAHGTALGLLDSVATPVCSVSLGPGDTLVFYTDGVTERRRRGEFFGVDRLLSAAAPLVGYPADVVAAQLRAAALGFSAEPPRDDIAILVLRNDAAAAA